jgi:hypothetical protein
MKKYPILTYKQKQMILGSLLGDAGLSRRVRNGHEQFEFYVAHGSDQEKYINHTASLLNASVGCYYKGLKSFGPGGKYYRYSYSNKGELQTIYKLCFKNGKKFVSNEWVKEIDISAIAYWFMDDGSAYHRRPVSPTKQVIITLSCECFVVDDIDFLVTCLIRDVHLPFKRSKCNSGVGYRISLSQSHAQQFYSYIGKCPINSLQYKWK